MAQAAITGQVHQPLDVHRGFAAQVAFDGASASSFRGCAALPVPKGPAPGGCDRYFSLFDDLAGL